MKKKPTATQAPSIKCAHTALLPVAELAAKIHPANPNQHPPAQVEVMAKIIEHTGWRRPIRLSKRSGLITAGHCSLLACQLRGWLKAPVDLQDYATEADELADLAADNELARHAQTNDAALQALLKSLDTAGLDRELAGILAELSGAEEAEIVPLEIKAAPTYAWLLVGIAIHDFGRLTSIIEAIRAVPDAVMETTYNEQIPPAG